MTGDWNDVEAAARVGTSQCQMAIVRVESPSPERFIFSITTPTDEHGKLTARRRLPADPSLTGAEGPVAIEWNASIGLFGDSTQEKKLLQAVQARLMDLKGVDWAPMRKR